MIGLGDLSDWKGIVRNGLSPSSDHNTNLSNKHSTLNTTTVDSQLLGSHWEVAVPFAADNSFPSAEPYWHMTGLGVQVAVAVGSTLKPQPLAARTDRMLLKPL